MTNIEKKEKALEALKQANEEIKKLNHAFDVLFASLYKSNKPTKQTNG